MYGDYGGAMASMLTMVLFYLVIFAVAILNYILRGVAINEVSKKRGIPNGFLGFIPYANMYQMGILSGEVTVFGKRISNPGLASIIAGIAGGMASGILFAVGFGIYTAALFAGGAGVILGIIAWIIIIVSIALLVAITIFTMLMNGTMYYKIYTEGRESINFEGIIYLILTLFSLDGIVFYYVNKKNLYEKFSSSQETNQ